MSQFDIFAATEFDAFETLKAERRAEIHNKGVKFTLDNSEKTLAGIANIDEKSLLLTDEINIRPGNILRSSKTGKVFITQVQKHHGYQKAAYAEITSTLQTYAQKHGNWTPTGTIISLKHPNGSSSPCVPATQCPRIGSVVKYGSILHTVKSTASAAPGIVELHLDIMPAPSLPQAKRHENRPVDPVNIEQRQFSVMQWRN